MGVVHNWFVKYVGSSNFCKIKSQKHRCIYWVCIMRIFFSWEFFPHFLVVLLLCISLSVSYRYRQIWKLFYRFFIGIDRYENWKYRWLSVSADMEKSISFVHCYYFIYLPIFFITYSFPVTEMRWDGMLDIFFDEYRC